MFMKEFLSMSNNLCSEAEVPFKHIKSLECLAGLS